MFRTRSLTLSMVIVAVTAVGWWSAASGQDRSPDPTAALSPSPAAAMTTLPPDGSWQAVLTLDELRAAGATEDWVLGGTYTWTFGHGRARVEATYDDGRMEACEGDMEVVGDLVRITQDCEVDDIRWTLDDAGLHLELVATGGPFDFNKAYLEAKPWQLLEPDHPVTGSARIVEVAELDERTVDLTIDSPSVGRVKTRLLLPAAFGDDSDATFPVLYLLHGAWDDYTSWTRETDVADLTSDLDLLVVMPEGGDHGFYTDWWDGGDGRSAWETFHLTELRELLEQEWQAGNERVIAGLSMGGYGAMHYASAHPQLFRAAASFSGVLDPVHADFDLSPELWGDPVAQAANWALHDTVGMAGALAGKPLYVSWNDGQPGPLDPTGAEFDDLEAWVAPQNEAFVSALEAAGIPVTAEIGHGRHEWPYWEQGLHRALPLLLEALAE